MRKYGWTVMFVPHTGGKRKSVLLTRERLHVLLVISVFCTVVLLRLAYGYSQRQRTFSELKAQRTRVVEMQQKLAEQQATIDGLNGRLEELNAQMADLTQLEIRVRELAGLSDVAAGDNSREVAQGGRGGPDGAYNTFDAQAVRMPVPQTQFLTADSLSGSISQHQASLSELADALQTEYDKIRSIPCIRPATDDAVWISSAYGWRNNPFSGNRQFHEGMDLAGPLRSPVIATGDGEVVTAEWDSGLGWKLEIDHGFGYMTRYGHNDKLLVKEGDIVKRGDTVALLGSTGKSTGPHVHYEVLFNGKPQNPFKYFLD